MVWNILRTRTKVLGHDQEKSSVQTPCQEQAARIMKPELLHWLMLTLSFIEV